MQDYVIVGAGSAGCVLANRLSADPNVRVLLLEAGGPDKKTEIHIPAAFAKLFNTEYDWAYSTAPEPALAGRELFWPRGKTLGGSSSLNAQMYVRGNRADYDGWAALGNTGWGYDDVLPFFTRSEANTHGASQYHGDRGTLTVSDLRDPNPLSSVFVDAAVEAGIKRNDDINGAEQDGVGLSHVTQTRGSRCSTADAFLKPIRKRENLTVVTGAHVTRVVLDGTRAVGVEYSVGGVTQTAEASREVILSGGAINSPQLLMLSGIGPAAHLRDHAVDVACDLPGVGRHLQDHLSVPVIRATNDPVTLALGRVALEPGEVPRAEEGHAHVERRRGDGVRALVTRSRRARPAADLRAGAVHEPRHDGAARPRRDHRCGPAPTRERGRPRARVGRPVRGAGDPRPLPHRPRRRRPPRARVRA